MTIKACIYQRCVITPFLLSHKQTKKSLMGINSYLMNIEMNGTTPTPQDSKHGKLNNLYNMLLKVEIAI